MPIANGLSCDVAAAMLARPTNSPEPAREELTAVVLAFHTTLRQLTSDERRRRRQQLAPAPVPPAASNAASAGH